MAHTFLHLMALRPLARRAALVALVVFNLPSAFAAGHSLRFFGAGAGDIDRIKVQIDNPVTALPGPPADVGATDFTLEFWLMASAAQNTAPAVACGANQAWTAGNVVVDRDRAGADRKFGIAIAGGSGGTPTIPTLCWARRSSTRTRVLRLA